MNKKIFSATLFGALMALSAGTFVSCQDYDDDINNLQQQITSNANAIAALESQIKSGEWIQSVTSTTDGIVITLSNGSSYTINNGKDGAAGKDGVTPKIAVNNGKIQVSYNDGSTWTDLISLKDLKGEQGEQGEQGAAGVSPVFSLGENGHIYAQYGEDGEKKDLGVSTGGIYYVEDGVKLTIHVPDQDGEYKDIVLPRAAAISGITAVTVDTDNATLADGADITLAYGKAIADGKYFDGTAFKAGDILLPTKEAKNVISAQVNPTIADATVYNFYLVNSKGSSIFNLSAATPNMTEKALTRAATANKGIYDMGITFVDGITATQIAKAEGNYAIATKDAYDNEVLSAYDVEVTPTEANTTTFSISGYTKEVEINKDFDLNKLVNMTNVIDIQYYFPTSQTAAADAAKATITGTKIKGEVANKSVQVGIKYMTYSGSVEDGGTITITFTNPATENAYTEELTLNADGSKNVLTFDLTSLFGNTVSSISSSTTIGAVKYTVATKDKNNNSEYAKGTDAIGFTTPASIVTTNATSTANGYYKHTLTYTVNKATVVPGTYEAEFKYGTSPVNTVKLTLIVKEDAAALDFKPLDLYFTGTDATAYGTPNAGKIKYNLKGLFGITDWDNVAFTETVPEEYEADGITWTANKWLVEGDELGKISVDKVRSKTGEDSGNFGGAYEARSLKATYTPYGNKNLTATAYNFTLTIKSAVFEGSLDYVKQTASGSYVAGDNKTIKVAEVGAKAILKASEIRGVTKTNVTYFANSNTSNAHVTSVKVALEGDNAKQYLELSGSDFTSDITITPKANVTIPGDGKTVTCYVRISVLDEWGKTKTVDVPVILK